MSGKTNNPILETCFLFQKLECSLKVIKGEKDFINKYPFVSYQFDLFQQCIRALSTHNAFQGKHASVGERSMLGVFQHVVQQIETKDENALVSFDLLFEGHPFYYPRRTCKVLLFWLKRQLDSDFAIKSAQGTLHGEIFH